MVTGTPSHATVSGSEPARPGRGPFSRWPRSADVALAAVVFVLEVIGILGRVVQESGEFSISMLGDVSPATYLLLAVSSIALIWRTAQPMIVVAITLGASIVWDVLGLAYGPSLAILIALYSVGRYVKEDRTSYLAVAAAVVLAITDDLVESESASTMALTVGIVVLAWYVGRRVRGRRDYLALLEERAGYLERERVAEAQRAVTQERTRIARELHDLVAHRVSMITVQAGAAQTVASSDPAKAIRAMEAVEQAGREALDELRQVLGVLRTDDADALAPMHGVSEIPTLVSDMRDAGVDVAMSTEGVPDDVPARIELAAYRIVQEALTNVLKHGGPSPSAEVHLAKDGQMLSIEVTDRGTGGSSLPGSGQGLVGMRERATLLGGSFEAGLQPGGGFQVNARLPLERRSS